MISSSGVSDFKLGDWWVRPGGNELEREGESAHVEARSMAVLVCLGKHAPAIVSKERLLEEVWHDSPYVGEDVISHAIWELRKALGDSARSPAYIRTVPRKGYQLVAEILRPQGSPLPMAGVRIDHYDIGEELGRGAMGVVYEAVDGRLGRTVAIKFLAAELTKDPEACRRFEREARLAASLEHPNLATVHEIGETSQGYRYLVSSYYRGGSLKDRLAEGPVGVDKALRLVRQMVAGLGAAHARDIVHRDIKPANLLLDEHGTLKICDFGIAKLLGATDLTRTGVPIGTPAYKSPEQTEGRPVDHRTDLWSAGVVCFELLTGRRPFGGEEHAVARSILSKDPEVLEDANGRPIPEPVRLFVARAMAKDPAERFQSAEEMASDLDGLASETTVSSHRDKSWPWIAALAGCLIDFGSFARRWRGVSVALTILIAILAVGLLLHSEGAPQNTQALEAETYLNQARKLWLRGNNPTDLDEAERLFTKAVELQPDSADTLANLAVFLADRYFVEVKKEQRDAAHSVINRALEADANSALARAARARLLIKDKKYIEGEQLAREAIRIEPRCGKDANCDLAYIYLADALWRQGQKEAVLKPLTECSTEGGGPIRCRLRKALFYEKLGDRQKAEDEYERVLDYDYQQTTALHDYSILLLTQGRFREAGPPLRQLYTQTRDPRVLNSLGNAQYGEKVWNEAIETYQLAHEGFESMGITMPTPLVAIGDIYMEQGEPENARPWYQRALEKFNSLVDPGITKEGERAVCLAKLEHFEEAEAVIERLLGGTQGVSNTLIHAARIYALKGDEAKLFEAAHRWQKSGRDSARFFDDAAFIRYRKNSEYKRILDPYLFSDQ